MNKNGLNDSSTIYQIQVRGQLDKKWSTWFNGFEMMYVRKDTIFIGSVADQAALHGLLAKIRDLGLTIQLVKNLSSEEKDVDIP